MTKQPSYRFTDYDEPWSEKKLGEVYSFSQGQQVPVEEQFEQINENRIRFIRIVDLTNKGEEMRYIEFKSSTGRVYEKDIFFVRYGAVGVVGIGYDGIIANNLFKLNPQMSVDNKFMYVQFNREKFKKTLQGFSASTTMPAISFTDIRTIDIYLPSLPEQEAIGSFFQDIDQFISLQQRKLEVLKEQKKTYLKLLFPAKGQTKPALRFAGFEDEWKEVKLGEVTDRYDNLRVPISANERVSGDTPYYGANGIQDYVDGYTHDGEFILIAEDGASDLKDYPVQYVNGKVWVNNHAHVIQGKKDLIINIFLLFAVKQINIEPFLVGGGRAKLNSDIMMKLPLHLPTLPEQEAIGSFFQDLDKAIAKQEEKVNQLKESKQTLLRKMFI